MSLFEQTLILVDLDRGSWPTTAEETGLDYDWLRKLGNRKINDPGVKKIEKLHAYLADKHCAVAEKEGI